MSLVPSLLQAIVHVDGEALVMHAGDKPYVVAPTGQIELASSPLALDAVSGIVAQLLPVEFQKALDEFGAVQYDLPPQPGFPRERFTVVAARGGDDVWAEIRRRRVPAEDNIFDVAFGATETQAVVEPPTVAAAVSETQTTSESPAAAAPVLQAPSPEPAAQQQAGPAAQEPPSLAPVEPSVESTARLDEFATRLAALDDRTKGIDEIDARIQALTEAAQRAEEAAQKAIGPDGELQKHRESVQHLSSEVLQTQATLETLKQERAGIEELRSQLRHAEQDVKQTLTQADALKGELEQIRSNAAAVGQNLGRLAETAQEAREGARLPDTGTTVMIEALRTELGALAVRAKDLEVLDERVRSLQEAVTDRQGSVEAAAGTNERLATLSEKVDGLGKRFESIEIIREEVGALAVRAKDLEVLDERVRSLQEAVTDRQGSVEAAAGTNERLATLSEKVDGFGQRFDAVMTQLGEVAQKQVGLESLGERFSHVVDLSQKTAAQVAAFKDSREGERREDVETLRKEVRDALAAPTPVRPISSEADSLDVAGISFEQERPRASADDLRLPDEGQLWSGGGRRGVPAAETSRDETVRSTQHARPVPPRTPAVETAPPTPPMPPPPAPSVSPPGVLLSMARNPVRGDRADAPPPPADDTLSGLERLLRTASARGASTLYLSSDARPSIRVDGALQILDSEPILTSHDVVSLLLTLMPERSHEALRTGAMTEWICDVEAIGRVRCMSIRDHRGPGGVFRLMPGRAVSVDHLGLSPEIQALAVEPEGLVLVAGPRSSGKRTLISSLVDVMNRMRHDHVITIEREINVVHTRGSSFISQREVRGGDEQMLAAARAALREDPDVLVLEQIRHGALMNVALEAAASGHLVIGGFAAHDATETIDRIIDLYAPEHSRQVQFALADNLRAVVVQVLLPKTGGGRVAARELLLNTPAVASVLAEGTTSHLPMAIEGGRRHGMVPLNDALVPLVQSGAVDVREACRHVTDRPAFLALLKRYGIDTSVAERLA